jgi:UDP-N-acetylmuramate--alanine ligase
VVETDESDGSVAEISPAIAVITNLSRDHKEIEETAKNFGRLLAQTSEAAVVNVSDPPLSRMSIPPALRLVRVAMEGAATWAPADLAASRIALDPSGVAYEAGGVSVRVPLPGRVSVENSLHALAASHAAGIPLAQAAPALADFLGVRRRLERIGSVSGVDVFDDFAHNPVKIEAALEALRPHGSFWVCYQPHGYGPTRFFADTLIEMFRRALRPGDHLLLSPIYDAGGTADRSIRSEDLVQRLRAEGVEVSLAATREDATHAIRDGARAGDRVVVMGARDDTLPMFARRILDVLADSRSAEPSRSQPR